MKIKLLFFCLMISILSWNNLFGETIKVGFEPFPPLIIDERSGYTVLMLKEIEKISDFKFDIKIMPYNRAKKKLEVKKIDLMGHTPHQKETKEFYMYAKDLDWKIKAITDMFGITKAHLEVNKFKTLKKIGTPRGNKEFYSEIFEIPLNNFYDGGLENLLKMLKRGRIDGFIFERASTMSTLKKLKINNIYYNTIDDSIEASLAVHSDKEGLKLRKKLDLLIKKLDHQKIFEEYLKYINLPQSGIVSIAD